MEALGDDIDVIGADGQVVEGIETLAGSQGGVRNPGVGIGRGNLCLDDDLAVGIDDRPGDASTRKSATHRRGSHNHLFVLRPLRRNLRLLRSRGRSDWSWGYWGNSGNGSGSRHLVSGNG